MNESELNDLSVEPSAFRGLNEAQKERLTTILERYMTSLENGEPLHHETLLADNPDIAETLKNYFDSLEELHSIAAGFAGGRAASAESTPAADNDEKRIGDFKLIREIGRGGMGVVYEARQISLGRRVALKILPFAAVLDSKQIARFKNEAQAAAQVHHPNIVPVFAIGVERGVHYYAMQYIDGQPLDRAIQELGNRRRPGERSRSELPRSNISASQQSLNSQAAVDTVIENFAPATKIPASTRRSTGGCENLNTVVRLGIQAAEALHAAHEYGVVHRDIKPSNLLLDEHGKLWVTDFGLARFQTDASLTKTGDVVGTMRYMSPEQALGQTALVDHRTDIYSLGVTLYELLALQPAFDEGQGAYAQRQGTVQQPRSLRQIRAEIPLDLDTVVMKAMSSFRDDRYLTAQALADDLRRVLEGKPTQARPPTLADRFSKWTRRHKRIVTIGASLALLAFAGLATGTVLVVREKTRAERNFQRAEGYFRDAREAVDRFGARLAERLADVPGAAEVRRELLQETLQYYQHFVEQVKDNPSLQKDLAMTYSKVASLAEEVGTMDEALKAHRMALQLFEQLVHDNPRDPDHLQRLAQCRNNLGLALAKAGQLEESRRAYAEAIRLQEQLITKYPKSTQYLADLGLSHTNLGLLYSETARVADAQTEFQAAIQLQENLLNIQPQKQEYHRVLAASYNNLAALYVELQPTEAAKYYDKALTHEAAAMAAGPDDWKFLSQQGLTQNNIGALLSRLGQNQEAAAAYEKAIQIQNDLVARFPAQKSYKHDLAVSYNNHGLVLTRLARMQDGEKSFRTALELHEQLLAMHPNDVGLQSSLGGVYNNLGNVLEEMRKDDEAAESYKNAVIHQQFAYDRAAEVTKYRAFLSKHYYNYGRVLRRLGRGDEAAKTALKRKEIWGNSPDRLFSVAEELALSAKLISNSQESRKIGPDYAEVAMKTLEQAIDAGYVLPTDFRNNEAFAVLRNHPRYADLINR